MGRKKKQTVYPMTDEQVNELQAKQAQLIETDPKYSLVVDPEDKYNMDALQKKFVEYYVEYGSINFAAELAQIDMDTARMYFAAYSTQQEIRRIKKAMYQRQFATKLAGLDEIGGWLTALLTDEVPVADQIKSTEKLRVAQMLIDLHKYKAESMLNPENLMSKDIDSQIKKLSVNSIQALLKQNDKENKAKDAIDKLELSFEEKAYLESLPADDVLAMLENINNTHEGGNNE